jgi:hypothetical protein
MLTGIHGNLPLVEMCMKKHMRKKEKIASSRGAED